MRPRLVLRVSRYLAAFGAIGYGTDMAKARLTGLDPKSIRRAIDGEQFGEVFIAATIAALSLEHFQDKLADIGIEPTLDSLFEVVTEAVPDAV